MKTLAYTASLFALIAAAQPAMAQTSTTQPAQDDATAADQDGISANEIVVTATRRAERLQDVPLSVTAFDQEELTEKGIVGFEGVARETPGVVLNQASDNNARITARGISTNGWGAGLQTTTTIYLDELPLSTIGNTVTLNPFLYDVERVEFLRGPQGTLFGSGSLSGALRILTKSPELNHFDASALVDVGLTPVSSSARLRTSAMINVPLVDDMLGLRVVGFYRDEDGYIDNLGTGVHNSNGLKDWGGRATLLFKPTDRLSIRLLGSYEDSFPEDASLTSPDLGERKRYSLRPDRYTSRTQIYNGTIDYDFDFAKLTSSSTYSIADGRFDVDLLGTFGAANVPYFLVDGLHVKTFVQETRLVSQTDGFLSWVVGGFYLHRDSELTGQNQTTAAFLAAKRYTLPGDGVTFSEFGNDTSTYELAGFGELTFNLTSRLSLTGGLRYGKYGGDVTTKPGFNSSYFAYALAARAPNAPILAIPTAATTSTTSTYPGAERASWKASISYRPNRDLSTYATISTGYRTPVYNARAGYVSPVDPNDIVIPQGAGSDSLTNYEIGLKGRFLDGKLTAAIAGYYIDWRNIQVQANRPSDSVQFSTNIGRARSIGLEVELAYRPTPLTVIGLNGSVNDAKIVDLTPEEALISGAEEGSQLASPPVQGSFYGSHGYKLWGGASGFSGFQVQYVGSFPNGFPNTPGTGVPAPLYDETDAYTYINLQTGVRIGNLTTTFYVENLLDSDAVTYIHPERFIISRYSVLRPRTFGVRLNWTM
ncbi:TonB-dependent receptor [Sphingosinithalassobacter portus]|uniref:TonB-dependent receptor n=1 Tax=Stakelama portus TaxID=2676234 RepID=UPI000D6DFF11|nr:TonB-dependent receptor [Sphingosinithalassobacter portus]